MATTGPTTMTALRWLFGSIAVVSLPPKAAHAQIESIPLAATTQSNGSAAPADENVLVTGSRLATTNVTSEAPITVITAKQIERSDAQDLEDVLRKIPSVGSAGQYSTINNNQGIGASCIDLRNLGIARTLVLVNGKRFVHTGYGNGFDCVDLSTIPLAIVDRIEILKDGASTIYGADAVSGVINIITKTDYSGSQINLDGNISASGDALQGKIDGTTGFDFAQGRGNVTLSGSYLDTGPVLQKDRDWSNPVIQADNGPDEPVTLNSGILPSGRVFSLNGDEYSGQRVVNGQLVPYSDADRFPVGQYETLDARQTQGSLTGSTHYEVNDHLTAYVDAYYTHKYTEQKLAAQPISGSANGLQLFDVPAGNPYAEALGINQEVDLSRRALEWGQRTFAGSDDSWQFTGGVKGKIVGNWNYDGYYSYGRSVDSITLGNQVNFVKLEQEMGFQNTSASNLNAGVYNPAGCQASTGCVLANPFGTNSFSTAAAEYARFDAHSQAFYQFRDLGLSITNDKLFQLPYGPVGLAIGMEHRGEDGAYHPDPIIASGASLSNTESPTGGGFNVTETFGELSVPLLKNLLFAKDLSANVSGRFSDYNTFGSVENWKAGLNWSPSSDVRFRGNIGTATRQPQIYELFGGRTTDYLSATDPCDSGHISSYGALQGTVAANCTRTINGYNSSFSQLNVGSVATVNGGNSALDPETARTYTIGTVLTPRFLPNFTSTVDYFHTKIANSIGTLSTQYILDGCYTSNALSSPLCASIDPRSANGQVSTVTAAYQNLGETRTSGIDFDLNYRISLGGGNVLSLNNELVDTISYLQQEVPDGPFLNYKGRLNTDTLVAVPVIRNNATAVYSRGGFSFAWTVRYIDGMQINNGSEDLTEATARYYRVNDVFYHDIVATYRWRRAQFVAGIDNLFDKTPLLVVDGITNTDPSVYDVIGRYFYAKLQVRF